MFFVHWIRNLLHWPSKLEYLVFTQVVGNKLPRILHNDFNKLARPEGLEPPTPWFEASLSGFHTFINQQLTLTGSAPM